MIWLNPWALLGLAGIALPVLIHLLARGHAKRHRFPSLRFIDPSQLLPTRRTRVQDPLLLAVRCAIVALGAFALAQPVLLTDRRQRAMERGVARAIIVDTSWSMRRSTPSGESALDSARGAARTIANEAQASVVVEANDPAQAVAAGVSWLAGQYQRRELVVLSDFQRGQLDSNDVRVMPEDVSLTLRRIPVVDAARVETHWAAGDRRIAVHAAPRGDVTDAEWVTTTENGASSPLTLLGAEGDRAALDATRIAAATIAVASRADSDRAVAIVFPGYTNRRKLDTVTQSGYEPWMADLLRRLNGHGDDVTKSVVADINGRRRLVLFTDSAPASLAAARIAAVATSAISPAAPLNELGPEVLSEREVASLQRPGRTTTSPRSRDPNGESDARWLWAAAIVLLLIELPLRRRVPRRAASVVEERARAA